MPCSHSTTVQQVGVTGLMLLLWIGGCQRHTLQSLSVPQLIRALDQQRNLQTCDGLLAKRADIATRLGELGDQQAIDPLIQVLRSADEDVLSSGASGCQPGQHNTYPAAIKALGNFGPQAQRAEPRLLELLRAPETVDLTPTILRTLLQLESAHTLPTLISVYAQVTGSTEYQRDYLTTLVSFEGALKEQAATLVPVLQTVDMHGLDGQEKGYLLTALLYAGAVPNQEVFDRLLSDPKVLDTVHTRAFIGAGDAVLPLMLTALENFDRKFPGSELSQVRAWCGPQTLEGVKNRLRSKIFSILIALCTPASIAIVENYKRAHDIEALCETLSGNCSVAS